MAARVNAGDLRYAEGFHLPFVTKSMPGWQHVHGSEVGALVGAAEGSEVGASVAALNCKMVKLFPARWLNHRPRHCLPIRPGMRAAAAKVIV
jgi:hypothetical protein